VVLADLIPDRHVAHRLRDAIVTGQLTAESYSVGYSGSQVDGFSECKRLTVGLGAPEGMGAFESAVRSPTLSSCELAVPKILAWADGEGLERSDYYFRYWNGSTAALRPSVVAIGLGGTRILAAALLAAALFAWAKGVQRRIGWLAPSLFAASIVLTTDYIDLPGALVQAIGMIVTFGAGAMIVWLLRPEASPENCAAVAFAAGAISQFFGDLTNPDAAWAVAVTSVAVVAVGGLRRFGPAALRVGVAAVGWIAGFAWIWFSKWVIAAIVIGYDTVRLVVTGKAEERLGGDVDGNAAGVLAGVSAAWEQWWAQPLTAWVVLGLGAVAVVTLVRSGDLSGTWQLRVVLGAAASIPPIWHLVMRNHTTVHFWFTYRSFAVTLGIVLLAATARVLRQGSDPRRNDPSHESDAVVGVTPGV
jgi:uncharacterized protein YjeT (DUF2065 family)